MKKIIYLLIISFVVINLHAQEDELYPLSFGPILSGKLGISGVDTPLGRKNGLAVSSLPDFGLIAYLPTNLNANLGALITAEYSSYSFLMNDVDREIDYQHNLHYVTFSASFYFDKFWLGFGAGLPMSADYEGIEIDSDMLAFMADVRIGFMYPIYYDEDARLNLFIEGAYMLTGIYDDFPSNDPMENVIPAKSQDPISPMFNPRAASVRIGFNYMFHFWNNAE